MAMTRTFTSGPRGTSNGTLLGPADGGPKRDFHLNVGNFGNMPDMERMDVADPHDNSGIHAYVHPIVRAWLIEMGDQPTSSPVSIVGKDELISMKRTRSSRTGVTHEMKTWSALDHFLKSQDGINAYSNINSAKVHCACIKDDWWINFGVLTKEVGPINRLDYGSEWCMGNFNIGRRSEVYNYWRITEACDGIQAREGSRVGHVISLFEYDLQNDILGAIHGSHYKEMKFDRESSSNYARVWQVVPWAGLSVSGPPKSMYQNSSFHGDWNFIMTMAETYITRSTASRDTVVDAARTVLFPPNKTNWINQYKSTLPLLGKCVGYLKN